MRISRRVAVIGTAAGLLLTACAGGSDDDVASPTEAPPTASDTAGPTEGSTTTAPSTTAAPPPAPAPEPVGYLELRDAQENGEVDDTTVILSEFATLFGVELDGAIPIVADENAPTSGSHVLLEVRELLPSLDAEQRAIVEAAIEEVTNGTSVYRSLDDPEYLAVVESGAVDGAPQADEQPADTEPEGFRARTRPMIEDEAEVIAASRRIAVALQGQLGGPALPFETILAPPSAARTGTVEATTEFGIADGDRSCLIIVYGRLRVTGPYLTSVLGHEVMHCWQYINAPTPEFVTSMVPYYQEGLATWVGEQIAGVGTEFGRIHSRNFFAETDFPLYRREYSAFGFWSRVAELRGGDDALWAIIPELNGLGDQAEAVWNSALAGVSDADRALLASGPLRRPEWSPAWDMGGIAITGDQRATQPISVAPGGGNSVDVGPGSQTAGTFDLSSLPGDTSWVLSIQASTSSALAAWDNGEEFRPTVEAATDYCYGGSCECPDGTVPVPDIRFAPVTASSVTIAISGSAFENANAVMSVADIEEFCDEEVDDPELSDNAPTALAGTWRANPDAVAKMFEFASSAGAGGDTGLDVAGVTGDLLMTLSEDGSGTLTYDDVTIFFNDELIGELTLGGGGTFQWDVSDGQLRIQGGAFSLSGSSPSLGGELFTLTEADVGAGGTSTFGLGQSVEPNLVLLGGDGNRGEVFFPLLWTRQ